MKNIFVFTICFIFFFVMLNNIKASAQSIADTTAPGKVNWLYMRSDSITEKGVFIDGVREKTWIYTNAKKQELRRIKYKHGKIRWAFLYYPDGRIYADINRKGAVHYHNECGCP